MKKLLWNFIGKLHREDGPRGDKAYVFQAGEIAQTVVQSRGGQTVAQGPDSMKFY